MVRTSLTLSAVLLHVCHFTIVTPSDPPLSPPAVAKASRELSLPFDLFYPERILLNEITTNELYEVWHCYDMVYPNPHVPFGSVFTEYPESSPGFAGNYLFVGARLGNENMVTIGAFVPVRSATPLNSPWRISDKLYWYYNRHSYGFAPNGIIDQRAGDRYDPMDPYRLSASFKPSMTSRVGLLSNNISDYHDVFYTCPANSVSLVPPAPAPTPALHYPLRILQNEITVAEIKNVWNCYDVVNPLARKSFESIYVYDVNFYLRETDTWFIGARLADSDIVTLGAFIQNPSFTQRNETNRIWERFHWYNNDYSYGFATTENIDQRAGDRYDPTDPYRLSASIKNPSTNRVGRLSNNINDYRSVFFHCPTRSRAPLPPVQTPPPASYYPLRILQNEITLAELKAWKCYDLSHFLADKPFGSVLAADPNYFTKGEGSWFFGARLADSDIVTLGAFIDNPAVTPINKPIRIWERFYWYRNDYSYGFATTDKIDQRAGDRYDPTDPYRLSASIKTPSTNRVGRLSNNINDYRSVLFICPLEPTAPTKGTSAPTKRTAAPTKRTAAPTKKTAAPTKRTAAPTKKRAKPTRRPAKPSRKVA
jgi:hypothetical protein